MRPADEHLTPQELGLLLLKEADSRDSNAAGTLEPAAQQHLDECTACQSRAARYRKVEKALSAMHMSASLDARKVLPGPNCLSEENWLRIATGLMDDEVAARLLSHAAACRRCGTLLKKAMQDLSEPTTAEEEEIFSRSPMSSPQWQHAMAVRLAVQSRSFEMEAHQSTDTPKVGRPSSTILKVNFHWWRTIAWATASMAVLALAGSLIWLKTREPDVNELLAQAYTEQRTIELRMPGARYARMRAIRGPGRSSFSAPNELLAAKPLIKRHLRKEHDAASWLQAEGWAELLEGEYGAAIQSFNRALEKKPSSAELMRDAATAYFERGEAEGLDSDYRTASQLLDQSLALTPDDPVGLFNRAIVNEHLYFYNNAINDWEHYLRIDSTSEWAVEAKRKLDNLQKKIREHGEFLSVPLPSANAFAQEFDHDRAQASSIVDQRIDDYLQLAVTNWLPEAFPEVHSIKETPAAERSLKILGEILSARHGDPWLTEFMSTPVSPKTGLAVRELSKAVKANVDEDSIKAEESAIKAARMFRAQGNQPGLARSLLERIHALQRAQKGALCLDAGHEFSQLTPNRFKWIMIQWLMEEASCWGKMNDSVKSVELAEQALKYARQCNFSELQLRGLAIAADIEISRGRPEYAWKYDREGLDRYWRSSSSPLRAYSFYDNLEYIAEGALQWNLARAAGLEAVVAILSTSKAPGKAMAYFRLASTDKILGKPEEAAKEFEQARMFFARSRQVDYMLFSQLFLADLQVQNGNVTEGLAGLKELEPQLRHVSNYVISIQLYRALASAYLKLRRYSDSQIAAAHAIELAENGLRSIRSSPERLVWRNESNAAYRIFLESYWLDQQDSESSLGFWEWYRSAPQRERQTYLLSGWNATLASNASVPHRAQEIRGKWQDALLHASKTGPGIVAYAEVPDGIIVWSASERGVESHWISMLPEELGRHIQRFVAYCSDPESDLANLQEEGRYLYKILIAPVEKLVESKRVLIFELDGVISQLPVQALVDHEGRYLGENHAVSISLGLASLEENVRSKRAGISGNDKALVVNPPSSAGNELDLPPLPDAAKEAETIAAQFPGSTHLQGPQATVAAVQEALRHVTLFHFAGHALIVGPRSGLLLARSEKGDSSSPPLFDANLIRQLDLRNVELVVLSSCTTEHSGSRLADDPDSIGGALLRAGVKHVIESRWSVDSKPTAEFMQSFYAQMIAGHSASESLRSAAAGFRSDPAYSHPYYWAAMANFSRVGLDE
jgi:CHAT domain-containing protein